MEDAELNTEVHDEIAMEVGNEVDIVDEVLEVDAGELSTSSRGDSILDDSTTPLAESTKEENNEFR